MEDEKLFIDFKSLICPTANDKSAGPQEMINMQDDDGEYENLPFHGMQSPPNKVIDLCTYTYS